MKNIKLSIAIVSLVMVQSCGNKTETNIAKDQKVVSPASTYTIHLTRAEFIAKVIDYTKGDENVKYLGDKPCIVDFYASWCGPCKVAAPIMEELAKEYAGKIYIYKVSTENERQLATELGIQSIPTFIFFPTDGKPFSSQGIAKTPEETKKMFIEIIEKELLKIVK